MDLICVGDVMLDVRVDAGELARGGDVHGRVALQPGGTSANAAVWAAASGASARVHGRVGTDLVGRLLRTELEVRGVEPALTEDPAAPSGTMLVVFEAGERSMVADRGANARLTPQDLPPELVAGAVLVSGYLLLQDGAREAGVEAIRRSRAEWIAVETATWPLIEAVGPEGFDEPRGRGVGRAGERARGRGADRARPGRRRPRARRALPRRRREAGSGRCGAWCWTESCTKRRPRRSRSAIRRAPATRSTASCSPSLARGVDAGEALRRACQAGAEVAASASVWPAVRP